MPLHITLIGIFLFSAVVSAVIYSYFVLTPTHPVTPQAILCFAAVALLGLAAGILFIDRLFFMAAKG